MYVQYIYIYTYEYYIYTIYNTYIHIIYNIYIYIMCICIYIHIYIYDSMSYYTLFYNRKHLYVYMSCEIPMAGDSPPIDPFCVVKHG